MKITYLKALEIDATVAQAIVAIVQKEGRANTEPETWSWRYVQVSAPEDIESLSIFDALTDKRSIQAEEEAEIQRLGVLQTGSVRVCLIAHGVRVFTENSKPMQELYIERVRALRNTDEYPLMLSVRSAGLEIIIGVLRERRKRVGISDSWKTFRALWDD